MKSNNGRRVFVFSIIRNRISWLCLCVLCTFSDMPAKAQMTSVDFFRAQQNNDFYNALGNPTVQQRVVSIWMQLAQDTGRNYPVLQAQNYTAGQALPNGVILLDLSIAGNPNPEVTAFFLAHEWGHQVMGHPQQGAMTMMTMGPYYAAMTSRPNEDAADVYAAQFIKRHGYNVQPILNFLNSIPIVPGDTHSPGSQRANNVAAIVNGQFTATTPPAPTFHIEYRPCVHRLHQYDLVPCTHIVPNMFGMPAPLHPMGDMIPCVHVAHPMGDPVQVPNQTDAPGYPR